MNFGSIYQVLPPKLKILVETYQEYWKNTDLLARNAAIHNKYLGHRCFILTNGPSLLEHDLTKLKAEYTFALNHFSLHPKYKQIKPKFYLALDPVIFTRSLLFQNFYPRIQKAKISETRFFFPLSAKNLIESRGLFRDNPITYHLGIPSKYSRMDHFDLTRFTQYIDSSPAFVLLLAYYLGFRKMYILGSDFTNFLKGESHFYPNFRKQEKDPHLLDNVSVADRALIMHQLLNRFDLVGSFLKGKGVKIYNASSGYLDVFPRIKFSAIRL